MTKQARKRQGGESDSTYLLKLVLYVVIGSQWTWLEYGNGQTIPLPAGAILGIFFAMHDHFQIDRKIEYAVLLVALLLGFMAHIGIYVTL